MVNLLLLISGRLSCGYRMGDKRIDVCLDSFFMAMDNPPVQPLFSIHSQRRIFLTAVGCSALPALVVFDISLQRIWPLVEYQIFRQVTLLLGYVRVSRDRPD
jgi:hypothetical protein